MSYELDKAATTRAFQFQTNGVSVDFDRIRARRAENDAKIKALNCPVNVNSYQQVRPYIGEDESDDIALATFALAGNERAEQVRKARKLIKQNSFLTKFVDEATDGRIYGKFTFTTKSGRGNCKDQNLQQLPRSLKGMFGVAPGNVLVMSDFAQLELRMICAIANETAMEKLFKNNEDMHTYTADMMGSPRQQAKTCNFNLTYGGSAKMLQTIFIKDVDLLLPLGQVTKLKKMWHNLWRGITKWQEEMASRQRRGGTFETLLGRKMKAKLFTDAMNLPVQGSSAEVSKLAMHRMFTELEKHPMLLEQAKFVNFIHDSFAWECPDDPDIYEPLAKITAEAMQSAWNELVAFTAIPDLPMPVEVSVGYNWGDLEYGIEQPKYEYKI
jgi:DNA polymerase-1